MIVIGLFGWFGKLQYVVFGGSLVYKIASWGQWVVFGGSLVYGIASLGQVIEVVLDCSNYGRYALDS